MRHIAVLMIAVVFAVVMRIMKQHREKIMICGVLVMAFISGVYSYAKASDILPSKNSFTQTFYNTDYLESGDFPDAFLRLFLEGKKAYVKNDRFTVEESEAAGFDFTYAYYHVENVENYLRSVNCEVIEDESMNETKVGEDRFADFERLGYLNDMLRNTVMYTKHDNGCGNYFFFLWYYRDMTKTAYVYMNTEGLDETDEIVVLWQAQGVDAGETEDVYIMSRDYYEENIR